MADKKERENSSEQPNYCIQSGSYTYLSANGQKTKTIAHITNNRFKNAGKW